MKKGVSGASAELPPAGPLARPLPMPMAVCGEEFVKFRFSRCSSLS